MMVTEILLGALVTGTLFVGYGLLTKGEGRASCGCGWGECRDSSDCAKPRFLRGGGAAVPKEVARAKRKDLDR